MPPPWLTTLAHAFIASTDAWNSPGCTGVSTSAMTARRSSELVMPTSPSLGLALCAPAAVSVAPVTATSAATSAIRTRELRMTSP